MNLLIGYILTGALLPILTQLIAVHGGAEPSTMLVLLPSSIGMILSAFTNKKALYHGHISWKPLLLLAILDLASTRLTNQGLIDAGSTIYTVVHCSGTLFTALFAVILLHRVLNVIQWLGILVISIGLAIISLGVMHVGNSVADGILFTLIGSMIHSLSYIVAEHTLLELKDPIAPELLCAILGMTGASMNIAWQCVYTFPRYKALIVDKIAASHGRTDVLVISYIALVLLNCANTTCFYHLLSTVGSASTGVIKSAQAVLTFVTSHLAFCRIQTAQCFTPIKGVSLVVVLLGVMVYSQGADSVAVGEGVGDEEDTVVKHPSSRSRNTSAAIAYETESAEQTLLLDHSIDQAELQDIFREDTNDDWECCLDDLPIQEPPSYHTFTEKLVIGEHII